MDINKVKTKDMDKEEMLWIASLYIGKGYCYEDMLYGDDTYNATESEKDEIGEYMSEYINIGRSAFYEKYKEYKLY